MGIIADFMLLIYNYQKRIKNRQKGQAMRWKTGIKNYRLDT
jgi:hypothetical protein